MAVEWYVRRNDKKLGPFSSKDLRRLATAGKLAADDLLWKEGLSEWIAASRVESLFHSDASVSTQPAMVAPLSTPTALDAPMSDNAFAAEETSDPNFEFEEPSQDELPPLPPAVVGHASGSNFKQKGSTRQTAAKHRASDMDSTDLLCWWLRLYARVNFALSLLISIPMLLFGLFIVVMSLVGMAGSVVSENRDVPLAGGFVFGMGFVSSVAYIVFSLLLFMSMNVFTLTCSWGAEVLELLKSRH
jgi:uncharacterized membrane protein